MVEKVYYWIKLRMDFFKSPAVKLLRRMSGGDTYALIYLEMILLSLENKGFIYFTGIGKDMADELALILDEKKIDVEFLLTFLSAKKLIEYSDPNAFRFSDDVTEGLIGKEQSSAKRVRAWRKRQKALQSNTDVTRRNTELDKELDLELEKELDTDKTYSAAKTAPSPAKAEQFDWKAVIDYLNVKAKKNFKHVNGNKKWIVARFNDGYTLEDMKKVIDNQCTAWKGQMIKGKPAENYLRPETLFGPSKIEGYLNAKPSKGRKRYNHFEGEDDPSVYDDLPF